MLAQMTNNNGLGPAVNNQPQSESDKAQSEQQHVSHLVAAAASYIEPDDQSNGAIVRNSSTVSSVPAVSDNERTKALESLLMCEVSADERAQEYEGQVEEEEEERGPELSNHQPATNRKNGEQKQQQQQLTNHLPSRTCGELIEVESNCNRPTTTDLISVDDNFHSPNKKSLSRPQRNVEVRLLVRRREAGALIGKRGANIKRMREQFKEASFNIPDTGNGPERVACIATDSLESLDLILTDITQLFQEKQHQHNQLNHSLNYHHHQQQSNQSAQFVRRLSSSTSNSNTSTSSTSAGNNEHEQQIEMKLLINSSHAGLLIGLGGQSIRKLRNDSKAAIKIYEMCCPLSSERVCAIKAKPPTVVATVKMIHSILAGNPIKGAHKTYDALNFDLSLIDKYGGYATEDESHAGPTLVRQTPTSPPPLPPAPHPFDLLQFRAGAGGALNSSPYNHHHHHLHHQFVSQAAAAAAAVAPFYNTENSHFLAGAAAAGAPILLDAAAAAHLGRCPSLGGHSPYHLSPPHYPSPSPAQASMALNRPGKLAVPYRTDQHCDRFGARQHHVVRPTNHQLATSRFHPYLQYNSASAQVDTGYRSTPTKNQHPSSQLAADQYYWRRHIASANQRPGAPTKPTTLPSDTRRFGETRSAEGNDQDMAPANYRQQLPAVQKSCPMDTVHYKSMPAPAGHSDEQCRCSSLEAQHHCHLKLHSCCSFAASASPSQTRQTNSHPYQQQQVAARSSVTNSESSQCVDNTGPAQVGSR